jgi:hypothetical protein
LEILKEREHSEDLSLDGRIILNGSKRNSVGGCRLDSSGSGQRAVVGSCQHGNEPSGP